MRVRPAREAFVDVIGASEVVLFCNSPVAVVLDWRNRVYGMVQHERAFAGLRVHGRQRGHLFDVPCEEAIQLRMSARFESAMCQTSRALRAS